MVLLVLGSVVAVAAAGDSCNYESSSFHIKSNMNYYKFLFLSSLCFE